MSFAATSKSAACGRRVLLLSAAVAIAGVAVLMGGVGGASATSLALCLTSISAPTATPSSVVAGTPITYTATVTAAAGCSNGSPTGMVAFYSNYVVNGQQSSFQIGQAVPLQPSGTPGQSIATLVDNSLPQGSYAITASYTSSDESLFWDSGPSAGTPVVIQSSALTTTTMDFTLSPSTITVGDNVTFQVHITPVDANGNPTGGIATGTVHFSAGPTAATGQVHFASLQLDSTGSITFSYNGFVPGDYIVVASYSGDPTDYGISGQLPLTVLAGTSPIVTSTTIVATPSSIATGNTTTLNAHVVEPATQTPAPAGGTVNFFAGPNPTNVTFEGSGTLDANGNAQVTVGNFTPGSYTVRAQYLGSGNDVAGSFGDNALLVSASAGGGTNQQATTIAYTGDVEAVFGTQATLSGHLEEGDGSPLSGEPLSLSMGSQSCTTGATDGSGDASCQITITQGSGQYPATAQFAGDADWSAAVASTTFTVDQAPTQLTYTGATSGPDGAPATLSAHLTANGSDLAGEVVSLSLDGNSCTGTTDSFGVASCSVTPTEAPGSYAIAAHFADGADYLPSDATGTFTVTAPPSTTTQAGPVAPVLAGTTAALTATVTPAAATGPVTFSTGGKTLCTATLSTGAASCAATFAQPGSYTVTARYGGNGVYPPSSGTTTVLVYALAPGGGSFVVGDKSASGSVTFWGAQWAKVNALSGGPAPDAFKGFALNGATCGGTWSTDPGNSSPPPAGPLPAYMAVLVTSNSAKAGSTIYGNTVAIVIVQTNAGYKNDPGHAGTGTVVATLCTGSATLTKPATKTTYTGATQGKTGSSATLSSTLTDGAGNPLSGEIVTLTLGTLSCTDKTDAKGNASCNVTVTQGAGTYPVSATFASADGYAGSSASATFTVGAGGGGGKGTSCGGSFNGTSIHGGNTLWFNSALKVNGLPKNGATITFTGQTIRIGGQTISVPDAKIVFSSSVTTATTTFTNGMWVTTVPLNVSGNVFLSGVAYQLAAAGLGGSAQNVTWSGTIASDTPGLTVNWQWAAAAYTSFGSSLGSLGVKPVDDTKASGWQNADHAGTPESWGKSVTGGGTGGGGSNYTGSYSGTSSVGF
jgi:hypothetical protein